MLSTLFMSIRPRSGIVDHVGLCATALLTALALFGPFAATVFAQGRSSMLTPNRDSAAPGATVTISVRPALATQQPAGSRLLLRSAQGRRGGADVEMRIVEWSGDAIRAQIPRSAEEGGGALRLVLLDRRNEVMADSGNRMFRLAAGMAHGDGRVAGGSAPNSASSRGPDASPTPAAPAIAGRPDVVARNDGVVVPTTGGKLEPDPRTKREIPLRSAAFTTPGVAGKVRESEGAADAEHERRRPPFLRDQGLSGRDYRHFEVRSVAECHHACAVEAECKAWTYRPARRNSTFDNGDDGATCLLKHRPGEHSYARGYVSGIKPPPPAVSGGRWPGAGVDEAAPPVARR